MLVLEDGAALPTVCGGADNVPVAVLHTAAGGNAAELPLIPVADEATDRARHGLAVGSIE